MEKTIRAMLLNALLPNFNQVLTPIKIEEIVDSLVPELLDVMDYLPEDYKDVD